MIKNLLLFTGIAALGLWAAGYNFGSLKNDIVGAADGSAGQMSGRSTLDDDGWAE